MNLEFNILFKKLNFFEILYNSIFITFLIKNELNGKIRSGIGDWGLGIGDWGLAQSPIPNPQSPIPNPQSPIPKK
jgi:hypothetical protein